MNRGLMAIVSLVTFAGCVGYLSSGWLPGEKAFALSWAIVSFGWYVDTHIKD